MREALQLCIDTLEKIHRGDHANVYRTLVVAKAATGDGIKDCDAVRQWKKLEEDKMKGRV